MGRYEFVIEKFVESDIGVYAFDLRGHGRSEGKRGHGSVLKLLNDIQELVILARRDFNDLPIFLFGHSMGGNLVANYLIRLISSEIRGAIISSPWIKLSFKEPKLKYLMGKIMNSLFPTVTFRNELNPDDFAHDKEVGIRYRNDKLVHHMISAGLFFSIKKYGHVALERASLIEIPVLVTHGENDSILSLPASQEFAGEITKAEYKIWENALHEPHNDFDKEIVVQHYVDWVKQHLIS